MGNSSTKEARPSTSHRFSHRNEGSSSGTNGAPSERPSRFPVYPSRSGRTSRTDLFLGLGSRDSEREPRRDPFEHRRETKQEREARRLEREQAARLIERERSMKEEQVDGGYLVTQGVYVGHEDFSKPVVRQLMVSHDPVFQSTKLLSLCDD